MDRKFSYQDFGIGVITGLAVGAIIGVLMAPESGETTREKLVTGAENFRVSTQDLIDGAKSNLDQAVVRLEGVFGTQERKLRKRLGELRAELEKYNLSGA